MSLTGLGEVADLVKTGLNKFLPDKTEIEKQAMANELAIQLQAGDIIKTEAASTVWLTAAWRPMLMLSFGALIIARFLGWTAPGLAPGEYEHLWNIVEGGIFGYGALRSVEKVAAVVKN
jgi:hypothetical protein